MTIHNVQQQTDEWYELRRKYPLTASKAQAIGNNGKGLETLVWSAMAEVYSTAEKESFSTKDTDRGNELESNARALYEMKTGNKVQEVGFVTDESISSVGGASPDGLVEDDGLIEIKCFDDVKHFKYSVQGLTPESQYEWQTQMQMLFTGRQWVDFVAYNPNIKESLLIMRIFADKEKQDKIKEGLKKGEEMIKSIEAKLTK